MAKDTINASSISTADFTDLIAEYPSLVDEISKSKGVKAGQKSLAVLDEYRYVDAPKQFSIHDGQSEMKLDDVKQLVEWKLRHGKFRPTLMNLVSSNDATVASTTIQDALAAYGSSSVSSAGDVSAALAILTKLRGIGPATASLLLAVHDAHNVLFFSDEAFWWLCCDGQAGSPIKYNSKEYEMLRTEADKLAKRLNINAMDIEKAAYVLMKRNKSPAAEKEVKPTPIKKKVPAKAAASLSTNTNIASSVKKASPKVAKETPTAKRKSTSNNVESSSTAARRSKRLKG